jgi:hypothetical protein
MSFINHEFFDLSYVTISLSDIFTECSVLTDFYSLCLNIVLRIQKFPSFSTYD